MKQLIKTIAAELLIVFPIYAIYRIIEYSFF